MRKVSVALGLCCGVALCASTQGCSKPNPRVFRFTAIPNEKTVELKEKFTPLATYLSQRLGVSAEYVPMTDYTASVDAFVNGDVQLAWFGGLTGIRAARAVPGARAIAQGKVDPEYRSYFIANKSTGLNRMDDFPLSLARCSFTFGSDSSTSGRLMPEYFIRKAAGKSPGEFFGREMNFSGSHDKTAKLVEAGTFQAGALDYKSYDRMVAEKKLDPDVCRVIWVTPSYSDYHFMAHPSLDATFGAGFVGKLQRALIEVQDMRLLEAINRPEGLIAAQNEQWDELRKLAEEIGLVR